MNKLLKISTVPVRKQKGITSVLLSSFANKENKIERLTFDSNSRNAKLNANNEFYIGNVTYSYFFANYLSKTSSHKFFVFLLRFIHHKVIRIKLLFACLHDKININ